MTKPITAFSILLLLVSCVGYNLPFTSAKEKKLAISNIAKELKLPSVKYNLIKADDSLLFEVQESLKANIDTSLIKRRIDSFYYKNYDKKELLISLKIDRVGNGWAFEFDRDADKTKKLLKVESVDEIKNVLSKVDSSLNNMKINVNRTVVDTLR